MDRLLIRDLHGLCKQARRDFPDSEGFCKETDVEVKTGDA
jgi:hypothetical protein